LNEDLYGNVLIAVTEAVNNAIIHGNQLNENALISIQVLKKDTDICFVVSDNGAGFDYNNLPDPTAPENIEKENGRGVFLMKSLADEVAFNDSGNEVSIYFHNHA
jgi:serine/threonine-protein kinase RsbW